MDVETQTEDIVLTHFPTEENHIATKKYVDDLVKNIKWEKVVYDFYNPSLCLPKKFEKGVRYISSTTSSGWYVNRIYEYIGSDSKDWSEIIPNKGYIVFIQKRGTLFIFDDISWINVGTIMNHDDLKNIGKYSHQKIDNHIDNKKLHLCENMISHHNILDIGTYSHDAIDKHITNSTNAHFGQNLTKSGNPVFETLSISNVSKASNVVTKDYVDQKIMGLEWRRHVKTVYDPMCGEIKNPICGERHLCLKDFEQWKKNCIYEYENNEWNEILPMRNMAIHVTDGNIYKGETIVYNGCEWVQFGSVHNHDNLLNCGIYNHGEIDEHINNETNAHFGQDLRDNGSPYFRNLTITNHTDMNTVRITGIINTDKIQIGYNHTHLNMLGRFVMNSEKKNLNSIYNYASDDNNDPINMIYMRAGGTLNEPKNILKGTYIGSQLYVGHDGINYQTTSSIQCVSTEDFNTHGRGSTLIFSTTKNNTMTPRLNMQIENDGQIDFYCTNDCISLTQGSCVVYGGMSINKSMLVGENVKMNKNLLFGTTQKTSLILNDTIDMNDNKILKICGGGSDNNKRGSMIVLSGIDSIHDGNIQIMSGYKKGNIQMITNDKIQLTINGTGQCLFENNENINSNNSGSIVTRGGVNIGKNVLIQGDEFMYNTKIFNIRAFNEMNHNDTQINLCGGNSIDDGSYIQLNGNQNGIVSGSIIMQIGNSLNSKMLINYYKDENVLSCCQITHEGKIHIPMTYDSIDMDTGSIIIDGGVSIKKTANVSEIICTKSMRLPSYSNEPYGEIGMIYYDTFEKSVKIFTSDGWKKLKIEK